MDLVSQSQITLFRDCERKWAWKYIAGVPDPSGFAAALGTEVDDTQLQPYLRDDRPIDFTRESGYIAASGLAFLPAPKSHDLKVQHHFTIPSPTFTPEGKHVGFGYQGYIDLWLPNGGMPDIPLYEGRSIPVVGDFKTTGNWKYQKHAKQLETDVQAQLYATWAMYATKSRVIDLVWVYFGTKGKRIARRSHLRVHADHVAQQFTAINNTALRMYDVRKAVVDPLELPPNVAMCRQYGGCPYESKCNLSPGQIIDAQAAHHARQQETSLTMSNTTQGTAGLLARLRQQKAGQVPAGDAPTASPPAAPIAAVGINPPESALPPAPPVGSIATPPPAATPVATASADSAPAAPTTTVRRPGRPRKLTPAPDPVGADAAMYTSAPNAPAEAPPVAPPVAPSTGGKVLEFPAQAGTTSAMVQDELDLLESVSVTWAEETFCPVAYNPFKVGPFEATGFLRKGETLAGASARIYAELASFAEVARNQKAVSFRNALAAMGGGK